MTVGRVLTADTTFSGKLQHFSRLTSRRPVRLLGEVKPGILRDHLIMRTTIALIGFAALVKVGLVMAAGGPPAQQGSTVIAAPGQPGAQQAKPAPSAEERAIVAGVEAFARLYSAANAEGLADLFLDEASIVDPEGRRDPRQGGRRRDVRGGVSGEPRPQGADQSR